MAPQIADATARTSAAGALQLPADATDSLLVDGELTDGYLYLPGALRPAAAIDGDRNLTLFTYDDRGAPLSMQREGNAYLFVTDNLGSPRLVVDETTDEVAQRLDYDVFGRITNDTNPGFQPFGFTGGIVDPEPGLALLGFRDYDPNTGWPSRPR